MSSCVLVDICLHWCTDHHILKMMWLLLGLCVRFFSVQYFGTIFVYIYYTEISLPFLKGRNCISHWIFASLSLCVSLPHIDREPTEIRSYLWPQLNNKRRYFVSHRLLISSKLKMPSRDKKAKTGPYPYLIELTWVWYDNVRLLYKVWVMSSFSYWNVFISPLLAHIHANVKRVMILKSDHC